MGLARASVAEEVTPLKTMSPARILPEPGSTFSPRHCSSASPGLAGDGGQTSWKCTGCARYAELPVVLCPGCGEKNSDRARFCQACATPLIDSVAATESRKTVTVLFCGLVGSTGLTERLDAETTRTVLARYFEAMRTALGRYGAVVEKFIGDAVMAIFGLPRVHEDDALRAVLAALDMKRELQDVNHELEARWGVTLSNRTGISTGEVVVGESASAERLATGDAVNVAARLQQSAAAGEILMGESTYTLIRGPVAVAPRHGL